MKKIAIILYTSLTLLSITSCTDLKVEVLNEQDESETISDTSNAGSIVAPAYAYLRDLQSRSGVGSCWKV